MGNTGGKQLPYTAGPSLPRRFSHFTSVAAGAKTTALPSGTTLAADGSVTDAVLASVPDKEKVLIFTFDRKAPPAGVPATPTQLAEASMAASAAKRSKTLRHPYILRYVDGVGADTEDGGRLVTVCEHAVPLTTWLQQYAPVDGSSIRASRDVGELKPRDDDFASSCVWGLYSLLTSLAFLHDDCNLAHGNVNPDNVYVTRGGDWKLAGFDLTCDGGAPAFPHDAAGLCPDIYRSPERVNGSGSLSLPACDAYAVGVLIAEVYAGPFRDASQIKSACNASSTPVALRPLLSRLLSTSPRNRPSCASLLTSDAFAHPLVGALLFLDALALKEPAEKGRFFLSLPGLLPRIPNAIALYRLLPALMQALEYGAAGGGGTVVLAPILDIGGRLPPAEYGREIIPCVVRLFGSSDRATRVQLLHHLPSYVDKLGSDVLNETVIPSIGNGFSDTNGVLRESTVKACVHLLPRASHAHVYGVLLPRIRGMLGDPLDSIRGNTLICLGRVAHAIGETTARDDIMLPAFMKGMRDPVSHARVAALRAVTHCVAVVGAAASAGVAVPAGTASGASAPAPFVRGYWSADVLARKVVPAASIMSIDDVADVREAALLLITEATAVLREHSDVRARSDAARAATAAATAAAGGDATIDGEGAGGNGTGTGSGVMGTLGWAVSSLANRWMTPSSLPTGSMGTMDALGSSVSSGPSATTGADGQSSLKAAGVARPSASAPARADGDSDSAGNGWDDDSWGDAPAAAPAAAATKTPSKLAAKLTVKDTPGSSASHGRGPAARGTVPLRKGKGSDDRDDDDDEPPRRGPVARGPSATAAGRPPVAPKASLPAADDSSNAWDDWGAGDAPAPAATSAPVKPAAPVPAPAPAASTRAAATAQPAQAVSSTPAAASTATPARGMKLGGAKPEAAATRAAAPPPAPSSSNDWDEW